MTVIVYQCDTCNRTIDLPQNKKGLEVIQRCVITDGCRGKLSQIKVQRDFVRGEFPAAVDGLDDWSQRKLLYTHTQGVQLDTWTVEHNLGVFPSIQVFVERPVVTTTTTTTAIPCELRNYEEATTELIEITPEDIITVDVNKFIVVFNKPEAGVVQCVARSSKPVIINQRITAVAEVQPFQLTKNSSLTLATISNAATVDVELEFITPTGSVLSSVFTVDNVVSVNSPWFSGGVTNAYINANKYVIRDLNLLSSPSSPAFAGLGVPSGSSFYIKTIDSVPLADNEVYMLLANQPLEVVDRLTTKIIDPSTIGLTESANSFYYDNGQLFAYDNLIESIYPPIRIL